MRNPIRFRNAAVPDAPAVVALVNSAYRGAGSRRGWTTEADYLDGQRIDRAMIEDMIAGASQRIVLGERGGELAGCFNLENANPTICHFGMFAIRPDLQAQGLGKCFMTEAERQARVLGCAVMRMLVITLRLELIAWYERRGYRRTGEREPFPYGDARYGIPLRTDLEFEILEKNLGQAAT